MEESAFPTLETFNAGVRGVLLAITDHPLAPKLAEMGLIPGQQLEVLFKAPFKGPIAVRVGGYTLSMRQDEARLIQIRPLNTVEEV